MAETLEWGCWGVRLEEGRFYRGGIAGRVGWEPTAHILPTERPLPSPSHV